METSLSTAGQWNPEQVALIKATIAKGANDLELQLFLATAKRSGLDPFARQIFFVKRGDTGTIQTSIDGYRLIAERTGRLAGISDPVYVEGVDGKFPQKATVIVKKVVHGQIVEFEASARWTEYVQSYGGKVSAMWAKMPYLMLGKCAEALALRKAFPANLSGLQAEELNEDRLVVRATEIKKTEAAIKTLTPAHYKSRILQNLMRLEFGNEAKNKDDARAVVVALTGLDPSACEPERLPEALVALEVYKDPEGAHAVYAMAKEKGIPLVDLTDADTAPEGPTEAVDEHEGMVEDPEPGENAAVDTEATEAGKAVEL